MASNNILDQSILQDLLKLNEEDGNFLFELIELFKTATSQKLVEMQKQLELGNFPALKKIAHSLKSSGGSVGALRLANLSERLEKLPSESMKNEAPALISELDREFHCVIKELFEFRKSS